MDESHPSPSAIDNILMEPLTSRELEVLKLFAAGFSNQDTAEHLSLAVSTIKWYARQIFSKLGVNSRSNAVERAREIGIIESGQRLSKLPKPATPFIGRLDELRAIKRLLRDPNNRLVTLVGLGGIGKTRLAIQSVEEMLAQGGLLFRDGVYFVSLETVFETDAIISAVAGALGFQFYEGGVNARGQLIDYLRGKGLLLVLDNFEQLIGESSAGLLAELIHNASNLKILITSRERLNQPGEQVYSVGGMHIPDIEALDWKADTISGGDSSVTLFLQTARRVQADFSPDEREMKAIGEICQLIEGMPLGIELAAAWVPVLRPVAFLEEIRGSLDILESDMHAIPTRQRSLRAVFDTSWKLLSEDGRHAVMRLSTFRGGFTRHTAAQVADVSIRTLLDLVNKSWIQTRPNERYTFHPVVQFYASEAAGGQIESVKSRYAEFFCNFIAERKAGLYDGRQKETLLELEAEISNQQYAWKTAIELERFVLIDQATDGYCTYFDLQSSFEEGARACAMAVKALEQTHFAARSIPDELEAGSCLLAKLLTWSAHFTRDYQKQASLIARAQALLDDPGFPDQECQATQAQLWCVQGQHIAWEDRVLGGEYFQRSVELAGKLGDRFLQAEAMASLGWISWVTGDAEHAKTQLQMSLDIRREIGDQRGIAYCLNLLGILARERDQMDDAEALQSESLALLEEIKADFQIAQHEYVFSSNLAYKGDFSKALKIVSRSEQRFIGLGYRGPFLAKSYFIKGSILLDLGRYDEARENAHQGLMIAKQYNSQQDIADALEVLGAICLVHDDYEPALELLSESYERLKAIKHFRAVMPLVSSASAKKSLGDLESALEDLKLGVKMLLKSRKRLFAGYILSPAALCLCELGADQLVVTVYTMAQQYPYIRNSRWVADFYGERLRKFMASLSIQTIQDGELRADELTLWEVLRLILEEIEAFHPSS